jgi:hypothetical protein
LAALGQTNPQDSPQIRQAIEAYHRSWQRMSEKQRQVILRGGGYTPEQYERLMRKATAPAAGKPAEPETAREMNLDVLHTMKTSSEDLNSIRDGNLQRVQHGSCAPEVSSRIAELKSRLAQLAAPGERPPAEAPAAKPAAAGRPAAAAAETWFEPAPAKAGAAPGSADKGSELDAVLGAAPAAPPVVRPAASPADEAEVSRLRAELSRLSGLCSEGR